MDSKDCEIAELKALVAALSKRIAELELELAKARKDSSTSSKPPSSDIVKPKPKRKKPGRRKKPRRGGQPGHQQQLRERLPPERVDKTIDYEIDDDEMSAEGFHRSMVTHRDRFSYDKALDSIHRNRLRNESGSRNLKPGGAEAAEILRYTEALGKWLRQVCLGPW